MRGTVLQPSLPYSVVLLLPTQRLLQFARTWVSTKGTFIGSLGVDIPFKFRPELYRLSLSQKAGLVQYRNQNAAGANSHNRL